jgi:ABC-type branched-subunit amino acid transport system permease subunit/ABC-type branched-subunit amino acid transport system ATPase component
MPELAARPATRSRALLAVAALACGGALAFAPPFEQFVLTRVAIAALFAVGFNLAFGYGGIASLGHAAFYALGAYTVALASVRAPGLALVAILAAPAGGALLGIAFALLTRRTRGIYTLLLTLMLAEGLWGLVSQNVAVTGGDNGIAGIVRAAPFASPAAFGLATLAALAAGAFAVQRFIASPPGLILVAGRESEPRVAAFGFDIVAYRAAAFALSGAICAVAGALHAYAGGSVTPLAAHWTTSASVLVAAILGGPAFVLGPALGAASLVLLETVASSLTQRWETVYGLTLIATIVFLPRGILGLTRRRASSLPASAPESARRFGTLVEPAVMPRLEGLGEPGGRLGRPDAAAAPRAVLLSLVDVDVAYEGVPILKGCSLEVRAGERVAIVGPNGAGKSTLFAAICGDVKLGGGTIALCGRDVSAASPDERARAGLGRTYQFGAVPRALSVREFLELAHLARVRADVRAFAPLARMQRLQADVAATLERTGLAALADLPIGELSAGTQRVVEIVATLAANPRVLLLDEPTAGLDEAERALVVRLIGALPRTIGLLVIEHDRELIATLVDRVGELSAGRVRGAGDAVALGS